MKTAGKVLIILIISVISVYGCKRDKPGTSDGAVPMDITDLKKDPNAYYDGCVSCTLAIEKRGLLFKSIFVKATFKNETEYPIPIEKAHLFIYGDGGFDVYRNGEEVEYLGVCAAYRGPSEFPRDYYILAPQDTFVAFVKLSKEYDLSRKGKYSVKYWAFNCLTRVFIGGPCFAIESEPIEFEIE